MSVRYVFDFKAVEQLLVAFVEPLHIISMAGQYLTVSSRRDE
jgi:hypothetical protein